MSGLAFYVDYLFNDHLSVSPNPSEDIPITGIEIIGESSPVGLTSRYTVSYTPSSTTQKGIVWTIQKGGEYAAINKNGMISILEGASAGSVTIRATSVNNPSIYGEKEISVTYKEGEISAQIQAYCDRVLNDGGVLLYGSLQATQLEYNSHKLLLGVNPRLDFLGCKVNDSNGIMKLYSIDSVFDCDLLENIELKNGAISTNSSVGKILWNSNLALSGIGNMTHMYYEGTVKQISSADSIFIANLLKTSYSAINLRRQAIFYQGAHINVQYAALGRGTVNAFPISEDEASAFKLKLVIDGNADGDNYTYVTSIELNDKDSLSQIATGVDFWGRAIDSVSFVKVYPGFKLCIAG